LKIKSFFFFALFCKKRTKKTKSKSMEEEITFFINPMHDSKEELQVPLFTHFNPARGCSFPVSTSQPL
jgi:hypothetical protein